MGTSADEFRWQAFFQHSREPVFVLNKRRRLLFANRAWESLTGHLAAEARGLTCTRRASDQPLATIGRTLCPPIEVMRGQSARVTRPLPGAHGGPPWWEIEFLPLTDDNGIIGILGKITGNQPITTAASPRISESLAAVRARAADHFRLDDLDDLRQPTLAAQIRLAASGRCPVYLVGEPGTGKHWLARAIHFASERRALPFVAIDCAHLPPTVLQTLLSEMQWPGTLYLREPAALPRELQANLAARFADDAETGPRVLAGTSEAEDPKRPVFLGKMLPELYDGLAVLVVPVPPLRARKDEMPLMVESMLKRMAPALETAIGGLTAEAWECVRAYSWPGNLREFYATLLAAGRRASKSQIDAADLPLAVRQGKAAAEAPAKEAVQIPPLDTVLEEIERRMIRLALKRTGGNQSKAAELLGVWRPRLLRRIKSLGLE